jgi:pimeloyl-ACP methyl ester carboxylesterase
MPAITVPVLIVVGAEDYFTPLPVAQIMQDAIPQAQLVCLEAAGHLPIWKPPKNSMPL